MKKMCKKIIIPAKIIKIILCFEPTYLWWSLPQVIIGALIPLLNVYAPKLVLEKLTDGSSYYAIVVIISAYAGSLLVLKKAEKYFSEKSRFSADIFTKKMCFDVGRITMNLKLSDVESPAQQDIIRLAKNATNLTETFLLIQSMISNIITIIGLVAIVAHFDVVFLVSIATLLSLKTFFTIWQYRCNKKERDLFVQNDRIGNYLQSLAYLNHGAQKELRINALHKWFMSKIKGYRSKMLHLQYRDFRRNALFNMILSVLSAIETFIVLIILVGKFNANLISIADFTMYFSAITSLTTKLSLLTSSFEKYSEQVLNLDDYQKLISLEYEENDGVSENKIFVKPSSESDIIIEFKNVSFQYPKTDNLVLKNINLKIINREKLVIVGKNGSGKTTLIKLLCKFYRPTEGAIFLNGVNIWNIPNSEYYCKIGAVFQDYKNFDFSIAEDIAFNNVDTKKIMSLFSEFEMDDFIMSTPKGVNTYISKNFSDEGIELSGGEGQKLAILRAVYKSPSILILDEPTASLDAKAESEIYSDFFKISSDKTTIFISHRLAAATIADHIAVFSDGVIVEYGSHSELMLLNGEYSEMYRKQSSYYEKS